LKDAYKRANGKTNLDRTGIPLKSRPLKYSFLTVKAARTNQNSLRSSSNHSAVKVKEFYRNISNRITMIAIYLILLSQSCFSMNPGLFSSATAEWETPQWLFDELHKRFCFTLDVCATPDNAKLPRYFTPADDGLSQSWQGERCFCNPPYGRQIGKWAAKSRQESVTGALVVGLLPARTDTSWWQQNVLGWADVTFLPVASNSALRSILPHSQA